MPDFRSMYDVNYLYHFDLKGRDVPVTIKDVKVAKLKGEGKKEEKKPIVYFAEAKDGRGLVLCKTNARQIADLYGNMTEDWIGKRITLFPTKTEAFGKTVDCIRIRPNKPGAKLAAGEFAEAPSGPAPEAPDELELHENGNA